MSQHTLREDDLAQQIRTLARLVTTACDPDNPLYTSLIMVEDVRVWSAEMHKLAVQLKRLA